MGTWQKFWEKCKQIYGWFSRRQIAVHASSAGFFLVLSLFPMLVLLLSLVRYTGYSVENLTELLDGVVPAALLPAAEKLIRSTYRATSGTVVSVSLLTALWSAGRGVQGLRTGMNAIYDIKQTRGYFHTRLISALYTVGFLLMLLLTLVLHVFGKSVSRWLAELDVPLLSLLSWVIRQRFFLLLVLQILLFIGMYMFLPNQRNPFFDCLPGAVFSALGWQVLSLLFSVYVENFTAYANIYGSVYAVALGLLWLYLCLCILFFGAALNRWLKK